MSQLWDLNSICEKWQTSAAVMQTFEWWVCYETSLTWPTVLSASEMLAIFPIFVSSVPVLASKIPVRVCQPSTYVQYHISNFTFDCCCKWLGIWFQTGATWSCHLGAGLFIIDLTECLGKEIIEENAWCYSFAKSSAMQLFSFSFVQFQFHAYSFTTFVFSAMDCSRHNTSRLENAR